MIVYDLACRPAGHVFEGWFGSSEDYASQRSRGLLSCPICGGGDVDRAAMAPRIAASASASARPQLAPEQMKAMLGALAAAQAKAIAGSDYVGARFATEARAIHDGDSPERPIHGQATLAEARALTADGIAVTALPLPVRPPGSDN